MSTTTKTLDITFSMPEQNNQTDIKTRKISTPANPSTSTTEIKSRIGTLNSILPTADSATQTGAVVDYAKGIRATFQEEVKEGNETYVYIPNTIIKAELVTITEDVIYGN